MKNGRRWKSEGEDIQDRQTLEVGTIKCGVGVECQGLTKLRARTKKRRRNLRPYNLPAHPPSKSNLDETALLLCQTNICTKKSPKVQTPNNAPSHYPKETPNDPLIFSTPSLTRYAFYTI